MIAKRRHRRIDSELPIRFGLGDLERTAVAGNISESGLYINTNRVFKVGMKIHMEVDFPERTVHQLGQVMWAIAAPRDQAGAMMVGMGIQFINPDPGWRAFFLKWKDACSAGS